MYTLLEFHIYVYTMYYVYTPNFIKKFCKKNQHKICQVLGDIYVNILYTFEFEQRKETKQSNVCEIDVIKYCALLLTIFVF